MRRTTRALGILLLASSLTPGAPVRAQAPAQDRPVLELTVDDAVKRALDNNADIAVEKYNPQSSLEDVRSAEGYYDPFLFGNLNRNRATNPSSNAFSGGDKVTNTTDNWNLGLSQALPTGGVFSLAFNNNKQNTDSVFTTFNPSYNSQLSVGLNQPLLKNFKIDSARAQIRLAKKSAEISDVQFRQLVVSTVASVKQSYYDLLYAIDNLEAARKNLALATKLLDENQIRVRVGTMAPLDVVTAESEVASREEGVIVAENTLQEAEDAIKRAIFPANDPLTWALRIVPMDRPSADPFPVDLDAAIRTAIAQRTDIVSARKGLERNDINLQFIKNQVLPELNLVAAYGGSGIGGTGLVRDPPFGGTVVSTIPGGYGDATSSVFANDFPTWRIGVNVSYSILNRSAKASAVQAQLSKEQAEMSLRRLELQVASEVRSAGRAVETNFKRVASTQAARVLATRRLDAEEKKFAAGMSTNFLVTQAQRDLAVAEVNQIRAVADYRKSVINFERSLEAGISGGGSTLQLLTSGVGGRASSATALGAAAAGNN
jgi:outer membrane protein TolC